MIWYALIFTLLWSIFFHRHSYFMKMAKEMEQGASSSSGGTIVSVGETSVGTEQAKPDIPIYQ